MRIHALLRAPHENACGQSMSKTQYKSRFPHAMPCVPLSAHRSILGHNPFSGFEKQQQRLMILTISPNSTHSSAPQNNAHDCVISSKGSSVIKFRDVTSRLANVTLRVSGEGANWIHCLVIEGGNVTIDCCELTCGAWGMCVSNKSNVTICGCHVHDNTGCGITVYGGSNMTITVTPHTNPLNRVT